MSGIRIRKSMNKDKPIERKDYLKPLSREHHHGLLLCWKIRTGFTKGISPERIKAYADWFYKTYLLPHFEAEEKYVFPVLGNESDLIIKATEEHRQLTDLFSDNAEIENSLKNIQTKLEDHIRFEERVLFNEIQNSATEEEIELMQKIHSNDKFIENTSDEFWKN